MNILAPSLMNAQGECSFTSRPITGTCEVKYQVKNITRNLIKGVLHPNQKLTITCFVFYLKIINTFLKNNNMHLIVNCPKNLKMA